MKRWVLLLVVFVGILGNAGFAQGVKIPLPEGAIARLGTGVITDIAFSPDGRYLAVATSLGIELRDSETLELIKFFSGHTGDVNSVAFSSDGKYLASGSEDKTIKLLHDGRGCAISTNNEGLNYVALCFSSTRSESWSGVVLHNPESVSVKTHAVLSPYQSGKQGASGNRGGKVSHAIQ